MSKTEEMMKKDVKLNKRIKEILDTISFILYDGGIMKRKILFIEILAIVLSMCSPNPVPVINILSPDSKVCHMPEFTLTVTGSGFVEESQIAFNGTAKKLLL